MDCREAERLPKGIRLNKQKQNKRDTSETVKKPILACSIT